MSKWQDQNRNNPDRVDVENVVPKNTESSHLWSANIGIHGQKLGLEQTAGKTTNHTEP